MSSSRPILYRDGEVRDAEAIAGIWIARVGGDREEAVLRSRRVIEGCGESSRLIAADLGGTVVGYGRIARFERPPDAPDTTVDSGWYLLGLGVREDHRRRGIATELTRLRLEWMADRGIERALYFADDDNGISIRLHAKFGFERIRRGVTFPRMREPDVPMSLYARLLREREC